jgi:hypothetical protein
MKNITVARAYKPCRAHSALKAILHGLLKFGSTFDGGYWAGRLSICSRASGDKGWTAIMVGFRELGFE